ncbi:lamin tail domain-containing protein [Candidatus Saccharibacteria bacterium]|nr:lamin tail domain-containing protein [Candidatus Saccharibacteria bacterium]
MKKFKRFVTLVVMVGMILNLGVVGVVSADMGMEDLAEWEEIEDEIGLGEEGGDEGEDIDGGIYLSRIGMDEGRAFVEVRNTGGSVRVESVAVVLSGANRLRVGVGAGVFEADSYFTFLQEDFVGQGWVGNQIVANRSVDLWVDGVMVDSLCFGTIANCGGVHATGSTNMVGGSAMLEGCFVGVVRVSCEGSAARDWLILTYEGWELRSGGFVVDEVEEEGEEVEVRPEDVNLCEGLIITEIGANLDRQFVEVHNARGVVVDLSGCRVSVRAGNSWTTVRFDEGRVLGMYGYLVVWADDGGLTMTRSPSSAVGNPVRILTSSDEYDFVDEVFYARQRTGTSWALFADGWKETYVPTPGAENIWSEFRICEPGRVINPETGNCVNEPTPLVDCGPGRYRSEETGRCRNIPVIVGLAPCREGYYRNPETNRCRRIQEDTGPAPCAPGWERNPETGRCRLIRENIGAAFGTDPMESDERSVFVGTWGLVVVVGGGLVVAAIQFRKEIAGMGRKVLASISKG